MAQNENEFLCFWCISQQIFRSKANFHWQIRRIVFEAKMICFYFNFCLATKQSKWKKAIIPIWILFAVIAMNSESLYNVNDSSLLVVSYLLVRLFIIEIHLLQLLFILCNCVCVCVCVHVVCSLVPIFTKNAFPHWTHFA